MKNLLIATFIVCLTILGLNIYWHCKSLGTTAGTDPDPSGKKRDTNIIAKFRGREIDYKQVATLAETLRDTLSDTFKGGYDKLHTGGVRFSYTELAEFMTQIETAAKDSGFSTEKLNIYICPGLYPKVAPGSPGEGVQSRITSMLVIPKNGNKIFDPATRKLTMKEDELLGAYNWGDLEP